MRTTTKFSNFSRYISTACIAALTSTAAIAIEIGDRAPDFQLPSIVDASRTITLSDYQGKVVYVDFWSSWCKPCRDLMPTLSALWAAMPRQQFEIVSINTDPYPADALRLLQTMAVRYPVASDISEQAAIAYELSTLPYGILVDQSGVIRAIHQNADPLDLGALRDAITALLVPAQAATSRVSLLAKEQIAWR